MELPNAFSFEINHMKSFIFTAVFALFFSGISFAQTDAGADKLIKFSKTEHNFGAIDQGKPVTIVFQFTNPGTKPLIIEDATAECGCTKPIYPKKPIMPGKSGEISVTYDAAALGAFTKKVTVKLINVKEPRELVIKGQVK